MSFVLQRRFIAVDLIDLASILSSIFVTSAFALIEKVYLQSIGYWSLRMLFC